MNYDLLSYNLISQSYAANRGYGMTHEQLLSIGIGDEAMKLKYELSLKNKQIMQTETRVLDIFEIKANDDRKQFEF